MIRFGGNRGIGAARRQSRTTKEWIARGLDDVLWRLKRVSDRRVAD